MHKKHNAKVNKDESFERRELRSFVRNVTKSEQREMRQSAASSNARPYASFISYCIA